MNGFYKLILIHCLITEWIIIVSQICLMNQKTHSMTINVQFMNTLLLYAGCF